MQKLWHLAISGRLQNDRTRFDLYDWLRQFNKTGLSPLLRMQLREVLSPCIRINRRSFSLNSEEADPDGQEKSVKDLVDWDLILCADYVHAALKDSGEGGRLRGVFPELLSIFSALLKDALDIKRELGDAEDRHDGSYWVQPSISEHPQNKGYRDWTALIELTRDAWIETTKKCPDQSRLEVMRWLSIPYPLFRRLSFFAATHTSIIKPELALEWLLADDQWWLWSTETQREAIRLLVTIAPELEAENLTRLERAILAGPPDDRFRTEIEPEELESRKDRDIWLRLKKVAAANVELSQVASGRLQDLSNKYPEWRLSEDERDEFPVWMGDGSEWRTFLATPKLSNDLVVWLRQHPEEDVWKDDDWRDRCKRNFPATVTALYKLARNGEWIIPRWRVAFQVWSEEKFLLKSWRRVADIIASAPDNVIQDSSHSVSWWLRAIANVITQNEDAFFRLTRRIIELGREIDNDDDDDQIFRAINHPIGHVVDAALRWWYRQSLEDDQGLPENLIQDFTAICETDIHAYRAGRIILASNLVTLFRVDNKWTKDNLLPLFDWQTSEIEASGAWCGFLRAPRLYRPLIEEIKTNFLATADHYQALEDYATQYAALLTFAALEPGDTFTRKELREATSALPEDGLKEALKTVGRAIEGAGDQVSEYWVNRALPYLKYIWPKRQQLVSPRLSGDFAQICIKAGEKFPEALDELRAWLLPIEYPDYVVHCLHLANHCVQYPKESLDFLDLIIGENAQFPPGDLKRCLESISKNNHTIGQDNRFQRFVEYLRRHDQW